MLWARLGGPAAGTTGDEPETSGSLSTIRYWTPLEVRYFMSFDDDEEEWVEPSSIAVESHDCLLTVVSISRPWDCTSLTGLSPSCSGDQVWPSSGSLKAFWYFILFIIRICVSIDELEESSE